MRASRRVVVPGEELGVIEEYVPLSNTYVEDGVIRAKVVGELRADALRHEVEVLEARRASLPREGETVYAVVTGMRDVIGYLDIFYNEDTGSEYVPPYRGVIHISEISSSRVRSISEIFGYGDVVRARVISSKPPFLLSTKGFEYGIVFARCPRCTTPLKKRGLWLYCYACKKVYRRRKVSRLYLVR